jgi:hypothetical protein
MAASKSDAKQWGIDQRNSPQVEDIEEYGSALFAGPIATGVQRETT